MPTRSMQRVQEGWSAAVARAKLAVQRTPPPAAAQPQAAPAPPQGRPRLVLPAGGTTSYGSPASRGHVDELVLRVGRQLVGRSHDADLRLQDVTVSMEHAELVVAADGGVVVRDLASENGVRVDGVPVAEADLHDGNRLQLGDVQLVYKTDLGAGPGGRQGGEFE